MIFANHHDHFFISSKSFSRFVHPVLIQVQFVYKNECRIALSGMPVGQLAATDGHLYITPEQKNTHKDRFHPCRPASDQQYPAPESHGSSHRRQTPGCVLRAVP